MGKSRIEEGKRFGPIPPPVEYYSDEQGLIDDSRNGFLDGGYARNVYGLSGDVQGLRVLHIGGGGSTLTQTLLGAGADAYTVDPRYADLRKFLTELESTMRGYDWQTQGHFREELKQIRESIADRPARYIGASGTDIPLPNDYFNVVCSGAAVFGYLDLNYTVLRQSVSESIRVASPTGSVRLGNYGSPVGALVGREPKSRLQARLDNQANLRSWLASQPVSLRTYRYENEQVLYINKQKP